MNNSLLLKRQARTAFSGGLFGVLIFFLMPNTISAFQVNSLVLDTSLTGVSLSATTWGDYDNDGDLDVVITGTTNGGNTGAIAELYDNDGNGSFTKNTTVSNSLIGAYRSGAAFGDYDNDGFLDLVIIGYNTSNSPTTTLYHNNGNGTFSSVSGTGFSNGSWASASWGDANNDGYLDLFLGGLPGGSGRFNTIYLNDKDGTFTNANAGILGSAGGDFVHADYDNDGDLDVAIAGFTDVNGLQSKFYRNDNGTYTEVTSISNLLYANDNATMEWGDYDNDGDLDLFNAGGNGAQLLINNGNGGLSNSGLSFTSVYESAADWIDYDLDGDLDLLYIGNISGSKSFLYDNNGDGTFTLNTSFSISGAEQGTVDWVDIDNDGDSDLLITGVNGTRVATLYENTSTTTNSAPTLPSLNNPTEINGTYTFTWGASTDNEGGAISYNAFVYDKDNNEYLLHPQSDSLTGVRKVTGIGNAGIDTVLTLNSTATNISWGIQAIDAAGKPSSFSSTDIYVAPTNLTATKGDLSATLTWNAITDPDFASYKVFIETSLSTPITPDSTTNDTSLVINNLVDGTVYYFYVAWVDNQNQQSVVSNSARVSFEFPLQLNATISSQLVTGKEYNWVDFDNDNDLDLHVFEENLPTILRNNGNGSFSTTTVGSAFVQLQVQGEAHSYVDWTDFNGDGFVDLLGIGSNSGLSFLAESNGSDFTITNNQIEQILSTGNEGMMEWGDFNNDGEVEIIRTAPNYNLAMLDFVDDSIRQLSGITLPAINVGQGELNWIDFNQDGYKDIAVFGADQYYDDISFNLLLNNGDSTFTDAGITFPTLLEVDMDWGDIDNDGDLDAVYMGLCQEVICGATGYIFKNNGSGGFDAGVSFDGLEDGEVEFGDYDNDGDLDMVVLGHENFRGGNPRAYIYDNDGSGNFTKSSAANLTAFREARGSWADFDNDGDLDLVTGSPVSVAFYLNVSETPNTPPNAPTNLALNIVNGEHVFTWDAATDVEGGPISYEVMLKRDNGYTVLNGFEDKFISPFNSDSTTGFRRITGMGNNDITRKYILNSSLLKSGDYTLYVQAIDGSHGTSTFTKSSFSIAPVPTPTNVSISQNGLDYTLSWDSVASAKMYHIYAASDSSSIDSLFATTTNTNFVIQNVSQGTLQYYTISAVVENGSESVNSSFVELNYPFILSLNQNISIIGFAGYITSNVQFNRNGDLEWVDVDNDGDLDLTMMGSLESENSRIQVQINNNNSFSIERYIDFYWDEGKMDWADYDGDGDMDLLVSGERESANNTDADSLDSENFAMIIYQNNSDNSFTQIGSITNTSLTVGDVEWVDFDHDGDLDIYRTGHKSAPQTRIYRNIDSNFTEGSHNIEARDISGLGTNIAIAFGDIEWIDVNGDGYVDYTGTGMGRLLGIEPVTDIIFNNGDGTFTDSGNNLTGYGNASLDWGDYDADGDPDLVLMGSIDQISNDRRIEIFSNDGNGTLTPVDTLTGYAFGDIEWGDFDNDGDLDLVANGYASDQDASTATTVLIENTPQGFTELQSLTGLALGNVAWGDYDNDGDLDLAMNGLNNTGYHTLVFDNNLSSTNTAPTSPQNIGLVVSGNDFKISWNESIDGEGGPITYNTFLNNIGENAIYSSNSDTTNGFFRLSSRGNNDYNTIKKIDVSSIESGIYRFGVQAIDGSGKASAFTITDLPIREYFDVAAFNAVRDTSVLVPQNSIRINSIFSDSTFIISAPESYVSEIYIDGDENLKRDIGESLLDQAGITFVPSATSFTIFSDSTGIESVKLTISTPSGSVRDTAIVDIAVYQSQPSYIGTANQGGWYLLSNPLNTTLGTLFENIWTQGAINADSESGTPNIYTFNPDSAKYIAITTDLDTTKVSAGEGILAYIFPDDNYNDANDPVNGGWPKTLSNYGNPFGENISVPIKNTDVDGNGVTSGSEGFQLMGNPYGFPVSVDSLVAELVKIDPFANRYVYRWDPINKQYNLNFTGSVDAYESFFVRTVQSGSTGNATFDYNDVHSSARLKEREEVFPIELEFYSGDLAPASYSVRLDEDASTDIDPMDGYYLGTFATRFANLYSSIGDQPLVLNNLPSGLNEIVEIPLSIHSSEIGEHSLSWQLNSVPEGWNITLENTSTNEVIDLSSDTEYSFNYQGEARQKRKKTETPDVLSFMPKNLKAKAKAVSSDLILRINPGIATGGENDLGLPTEVELEQNYPNPFNPSSVIRFGVPEQAPVQLEVFDILGRKVMSLLNGEVKQPGRYNINFDGRALASGMYIYRLVIGDKVLTKKMTLIK